MPEHRSFAWRDPRLPALYTTALDGENIVASVSEIGYLHRGFEKMAERGTWQQVIPYTDRLNYCSAMMNNFAYCRAVEELIGVEIPERAKVLRVIVNELSASRIISSEVAAASRTRAPRRASLYVRQPRDDDGHLGKLTARASRTLTDASAAFTAIRTKASRMTSSPC